MYVDMNMFIYSYIHTKPVFHEYSMIRLICQSTVCLYHLQTFRIKPPMCISMADADFFLAVFQKAIHSYMTKHTR